MVTATAMSRFEDEIQRAVVLALFVPLIISSGGNSGSQATTLIIRAMALGEIQLRDWWNMARREVPTGVTLGAILAVIGFTRILVWQGIWHSLQRALPPSRAYGSVEPRWSGLVRNSCRFHAAIRLADGAAWIRRAPPLPLSRRWST
jgi:hypothetical protein